MLKAPINETRKCARCGAVFGSEERHTLVGCTVVFEDRNPALVTESYFLCSSCMPDYMEWIEDGEGE